MTMKIKTISDRLTLAASVAASLALVGGCCTKSGSQTAYYSSTPEGSGGTAQETQTSTQPAATEGQNNMTIPLYKESLAVGTREVDAGSVRVKKIVKTETVNQPVQLRHEEIVIEREPGTGQPADSQAMNQAFQGQETTIHLNREEAVVEKRTTSDGQVVLKKSSDMDQTNIQAQVRSEDVDVVKFGNPQNVTIGANIHGEDAAGGAESPGGASSASSSGTITDPAMLSSSGSSYIGRSVQFSNVKVQSVAGDHLVALDCNGKPLYAYCSEGAQSLKAGDTVSLTGTIQAGSSYQSGGAAAQTLSSQPMYIDAQKIEPAGQ